MTRKRANRGPIAAAALALIWLAVPATAEVDPDRGWRLRFQISSIDFHNNATGGPGVGGYDIDLGAGVGVNAEYRLSRRLGVDLGVLAGSGVDFVGHAGWIGDTEYQIYDTLAFTALTAGLDIHLTPDSRADLYLCPLVGMMHYGGLVFEAGSGRVTTGVDFDTDLALGASLGLGVPLGNRQHWTFNTNLTYLESTLNGDSRGHLQIEEDYDAMLFALGFGYRF
jgi:hypothetical protein